MMCSLTKIQERSNHKISYGQYLGKFSHTKVERPFSTEEALSESEQEDLDQAKALSVAEGNKKGEQAMDNGSQFEVDEQIAKAVQESLDFKRSTTKIPPSHYAKNRRICAGCRGEIIDGTYLVNEKNGTVWHLRPECNRCHFCNSQISDVEECCFHDIHLHHKSCYRELFKCDVCKNSVPTNKSGNFEYCEHPFWHNKYCTSHESDGTPRCCSCGRMEPVDAGYLNHDDGRKLCLECVDSVIMATHECEPLYIEIRNFYEGLFMKVEQEFPLYLVERHALNEATEGEKKGFKDNTETRGLCMSEEQTVTAIVKRPNILGIRRKDMSTEPRRLARKCEVTAILILYGLPRLLSGSIIAHEMMHAWLRLQGYPNLSPRVEEGICQVLAHMWLDSEINAGSSNEAVSSASSSSATSEPHPSSSGSSKKGKQSEFEKKLGGYFKYQIESEPSEVYGDGFRDGIKAVEKYGLKWTLNHIRDTRNFPC